MTDEGETTYYLGLSIMQALKGIFVHQNHYVEHILRKYDSQDLGTKKLPFQPSTKLQATSDEPDEV
jgi:hypothetical protein